MATFQPDTSFERRRRRPGGERRPLAAVLADAGGEAETPAAAPVFTSRRDDAAPTTSAPAAEPVETEAATTETATAPEPAPAFDPLPEGDAPLRLGDDELAALLAGAAAEARGTAHAEAEAATRTALARAEATVAQALEREIEGRDRRRGHDAALVLELVRTITAHVVPRAVAAAPLDDLLAELPTLLARIEGAERVTIAVHPDLAATLGERVEALGRAAGFGAGTLTVQGEAALALGDAVVRWPDGEATRSLEARIAEATRLCAGWLAERGTTAPQTPETTAEEESDEH